MLSNILCNKALENNRSNTVLHILFTRAYSSIVFTQVYVDETSAVCYFVICVVTTAQELNHAPDMMILCYVHEFLFASILYMT